MKFKLFSLPIILLPIYFVLSQPIWAAQNFDPAFKMIEWPELLPKDDLDALMDPPDYLTQIMDGSENDTLEAFKQTEKLDDKTKRYQQALSSHRVIAEFNNKKIRIPGFVVPIFVDQSQKAISFFIVPYFGACLHMPPPPPNQIIYVDYEQGLTVNNLYDPFWFEGTITIENTTNDIAASAYQMNIKRISPYDE
ncbi:DUF3299 domain-containing protein [Catenovulum sp. 2E275]|uniref:DUF3299 domain-containing protein n=1 Tax=Catenovulum sp. 2E275 TaxID=2980497 RepID=UPI0021CEF3FB|nr:DUF3299 domain-containing protein [Catenovulum sp. 2E275]MCU4674156.1 DUF3299 domain-containing protein [Catenovulum sp. 2E275]